MTNGNEQSLKRAHQLLLELRTSKNSADTLRTSVASIRRIQDSGIVDSEIEQAAIKLSEAAFWLDTAITNLTRWVPELSQTKVGESSGARRSDIREVNEFYYEAEGVDGRTYAVAQAGPYWTASWEWSDTRPRRSKEEALDALRRKVDKP